MDITVWATSSKIGDSEEWTEPSLSCKIINRFDSKEIDNFYEDDVDVFLSKLKPHLEDYIESCKQ